MGQSYKKIIRDRTTFWLGMACLLSLVTDLIASLADAPEEIWTERLPLHFCSVMQVICALSLWIPSRPLRSVAYYCVLCATMQGLITPSVSHDFPTWTYFSFFLSHGVTVITAFYLPLALGWKTGTVGFFMGVFDRKHLFSNCSSSQYHDGNELRIHHIHTAKWLCSGLVRPLALVPAWYANTSSASHASTYSAISKLSQRPNRQFFVSSLDSPALLSARNSFIVQSVSEYRGKKQEFPYPDKKT